MKNPLTAAALIFVLLLAADIGLSCGELFAIAFFAPEDNLSENDHCVRLAPKYNAEREVRLQDGSRVDLLTDSHAIEVDWARKWAEGIGQASFYAEMTGKQPAVLLLFDGSERDQRYLWRARVAAARNGIRIFVEDVE